MDRGQNDKTYFNIIINNLKQGDGAGILSTTSRRAASLKVVETRLGLTAHMHNWNGFLYHVVQQQNGIDQGINVKDISDRSESRILHERVSSECTIFLNEAFDTHILKRSLLSDDKCDSDDLRKLRCVVEF
jgi:hypothetical protein